MLDDAQHQLGVFLRRKRESLSPELFGLPRSARARTPGLRRDDVAELVGISTVWYSKIERGKAGGVSLDVLRALSTALRLDRAEQAYVLTLAGLDTASPRDPCLRLNPHTRRMLLQLDPLPALLINDYFDIIAVNRGYEAMCGLALNEMPDARRNYVGLLLTHDGWREFLQLEDADALRARLATWVRVLRGTRATRPTDPTLTRRIDHFRELSPVFAECWDSGEVGRPEESLFSFRHAVLGPIVLRKQIWLNCNGETSGRLNVYHPDSDSDVERLARVLDP